MKFFLKSLTDLKLLNSSVYSTSFTVPHFIGHDPSCSLYWQCHRLFKKKKKSYQSTTTLSNSCYSSFLFISHNQQAQHTNSFDALYNFNYETSLIMSKTAEQIRKKGLIVQPLSPLMNQQFSSRLLE